jgi:hypothetical protein
LDGAAALMVVDCEGCELEVLHPDLVPLVRRATVIVELLDLIDPRISAALSERFSPTHDEVATLPGIRELERQIAVSELRPAQMEWSVFSPLTHRMPPR